MAFGPSGKQRSPSSFSFAQVPQAQIPRSSFDRSFSLKTTFDAGLLIPIYVDEALPGDTFNMRMSGFARLATAIKPVMDNLHLETFFFFVPNRLVWDDWEKFMGAQDNPDDPTDIYTVPTNDNITQGTVQPGELSDYFGIPTLADFLEFSTLHHRAYNLIWNEWFRDENLQDSQPVPKGPGPDDLTQFKLMRRGKRHDYFTSCLPWPQKGESVTLPLGTTAPVFGEQANSVPEFWDGQNVTDSWSLLPQAGGSPTNLDMSGGPGTWSFGNAAWLDPKLVTDLSQATAATINDIRQAFQVQRLLERDARSGTRYTEVIKAHFGVTSPDMRLQRPEYLGGGYTPVTISPIAQTSQTDAQGPDASPQANLAAIGTASWSGHGFVKSFTEHGVLIGLACVRADLTYQQGINRMWGRKSRFDFYWPVLAHLGEQAVLQSEIYAEPAGGPPNIEVFGYQERYAEYRYKPSQITGLFRSNHPETLDVWHLAQEFQVAPQLNDIFIEENPPIDRVIAVQDEPHFLFDAHFSLRCARPMPLYGVPGLVDHF